MHQAFALKTTDSDFDSVEEEIIKAMENEYEDEDGNYKSTSIKAENKPGNTKPDFKRQQGIIEGSSNEGESQYSCYDSTKH